MLSCPGILALRALEIASLKLSKPPADAVGHILFTKLAEVVERRTSLSRFPIETRLSIPEFLAWHPDLSVFEWAGATRLSAFVAAEKLISKLPSKVLPLVPKVGKLDDPLLDPEAVSGWAVLVDPEKDVELITTYNVESGAFTIERLAATTYTLGGARNGGAQHRRPPGHGRAAPGLAHAYSLVSDSWVLKRRLANDQLMSADSPDALMDNFGRLLPLESDHFGRKAQRIFHDAPQDDEPPPLMVGEVLMVTDSQAKWKPTEARVLQVGPCEDAEQLASHPHLSPSPLALASGAKFVSRHGKGEGALQGIWSQV